MDSISFQGTARRSASERVSALRHEDKARRGARNRRMDNSSASSSSRNKIATGGFARWLRSTSIIASRSDALAVRAMETSRDLLPRGPRSPTGSCDLPLDLWREQTLERWTIRQEKVIDSAPEIDRAGKARPRQRLLSLPGKRAASSTSGVHVVRARD